MSNKPAASVAVTSEAGQTTPTSDGGAMPGVSVESIAATLSGEMPEVQAHAVAAAREESASQVGRDVNGEEFNSAIHVAGTDGAGVKSAKGAWTKKRGRKPGSAGNAPSATAAPGQSRSRVGTGEPPPPSKEQLARASGVGAANLFFVAAIICGGEEWQPTLDPTTGVNEKQMMEGVFADYFVATGKTDLPPGWALAAGIGMYAAKRFTMPKTINRITRLKMWVGAKIGAFKMRKRKSTVQPYDTIDGDADPRDRRVWAGGHTHGPSASAVENGPS